MRRLSTAGTAIVMCLALGGVQAAAQTTNQPGVGVTVTQDCIDISATPIVCTWTASDPRLTGTMTHEWVDDIELADDGADGAYVDWAPAALEGPEGDWTGHLYATWTDPPRLFVFLSGDGAYEGWQYVGSTIDDGEEIADGDWVGAMYEGEPPPFGPRETPAE